MHLAVDVSTLNEEIKRAHSQLHQHIRQHNNTILALGNYDTCLHYSYTRPNRYYTNRLKLQATYG
jgi:hypothetical protein